MKNKGGEEENRQSKDAMAIPGPLQTGRSREQKRIIVFEGGPPQTNVAQSRLLPIRAENLVNAESRVKMELCRPAKTKERREGADPSIQRIRMSYPLRSPQRDIGTTMKMMTVR